MPDDSIWIAVTSDGTVTAWESQRSAENAVRDDAAPYIELVQIQRDQ